MTELKQRYLDLDVRLYRVPESVVLRWSSKYKAKNSFIAQAVLCLITLTVSFMRPVSAQDSELFITAGKASELGPEIQTEPATIRTRTVRVGLTKLTTAHKGSHLTLNLFDDTIFQAQVKRVHRTSSGYVLSGHLVGIEWGEWSLAVNGSTVVGSIRSPDATYAVRPSGSDLHIIRQVDVSALPPELPPLELPPDSSLVEPAAERVQAQQHKMEQAASDDGSQIDVLVLYTPTARSGQGGLAGIRALIDLLITDTNSAYEDSGVTQRIRLVHRQEINYTGHTFIGTDLRRLAGLSDGFMDEIHVLRDQHAADLVHLIVGTVSEGCGVAYAPDTAGFRELHAFSVSARPCLSSTLIFAHELGHNMGLLHDRHVARRSRSLYPYSFGYVNQQAFVSGASTSARWRTIMAYNDQCQAAGFFCPRVSRFSNSEQTYRGHTLGVAGDTASTSVNGPADARRTLNQTRAQVASFRSGSCTNFTVSPTTRMAPLAGSEARFTVNATSGCVWTVASQAAFLTVSSNVFSSGNDVVRIEVAPSIAARDGTLSIAGKTVTVQQRANVAGICGRTASVSDTITTVAGFTNPVVDCARVTDMQLAAISLLDLSNITWLRANDFAGLTNLATLELDNNQLTALPAGIFAGLTKLESLWLSNNPGAPFPFTLIAERTDGIDQSAPGPATVKIKVAQGAPFDLSVGLNASGGSLSATTATIAKGHVESADITVTQGGDAPVTLRLGTAPAVPATQCMRDFDLGDGSSIKLPVPCYQGISTAVGDPLVLFDRPLLRSLSFGNTPVNGDTYQRGESIQVRAEFSGAVTVTGTPEVTLTIGAQTRQAAYVSGTGSQALSFIYTVQRTDSDSDGISIAGNALALNGGSIQSAHDSTANAALTHAEVVADTTRKVDGDIQPQFGARLIARSYVQNVAIAPLMLPVASGGDAPVTYNLAAEAILSAGLSYAAPSIDDNHGGVIAGRPAMVQGETMYTLTATDTDGDQGHLPFTIRVTGPTPDINGSGTLDRDDALVLFYSYQLKDFLGDGNQGGSESARRNLLSDLVGSLDRVTSSYYAMPKHGATWVP